MDSRGRAREIQIASQLPGHLALHLLRIEIEAAGG